MAYPAPTVRRDHPRPVSRNVGRTAPVDAAIRPPQPIRSDRRHPAATARRLGVASAALLLVGGYVHLCLYGHGYRFIPKIGVGFLLEAVSSALLAVALVVRGRRIHVGRRSVSWAQLTRLAAIGLSLGTLAALGIAHTPSGLFQFREIGLRPAPQTLIAIVAESLATLLLGLAMVEGLRTTPGQIVTAPAEERPRQTGLDGRAGH